MMQRFRVTLIAVSRPFPVFIPEELGSAVTRFDRSYFKVRASRRQPVNRRRDAYHHNCNDANHSIPPSPALTMPRLKSLAKDLLFVQVRAITEIFGNFSCRGLN